MTDTVVITRVLYRQIGDGCRVIPLSRANVPDSASNGRLPNSRIFVDDSR
jgi:hypothetical protein